jgi:hypothetical protein
MAEAASFGFDKTDPTCRQIRSRHQHFHLHKNVQTVGILSRNYTPSEVAYQSAKSFRLARVDAGGQKQSGD